jgi:sensor histidine kinase YesM
MSTIPSPAPKFRRRHYFIDRKFQGAFVLRFLIATCLAAAVTGWIVYQSVTAAIENEMFSAHLTATHTGEIVRSRLVITNLAVAAALLIAAVAMAFRVARGCSFALRRARLGLESVAKGDLTIQMWAKASDRLDDLFRELNQTIAHARQHAEVAKAALGPTNGESTAATNQELERRLRQCASALRQIGPPSSDL